MSIPLQNQLCKDADKRARDLGFHDSISLHGYMGRAFDPNRQPKYKVGDIILFNYLCPGYPYVKARVISMRKREKGMRYFVSHGKLGPYIPDYVYEVTLLEDISEDGKAGTNKILDGDDSVQSKYYIPENCPKI